MSPASQDAVRLAPRMASLATSPTMEMMAEARRLQEAGVDVVDLTAGEPDFPTPEPIRRAGIEAIREGFTRYTPNPGIAELRRAICERYRADFGLAFEPAEVIVTAGGKHALFDLMMALVGPGDEVVIPTPYWMTFAEQTRIAGGTPVLVSTEPDGFRVTAARLAEAVTERTRILLVCSPSNPTGTVVEPAELEALADLAARADAYLLWDDTYGRLQFEPSARAALARIRERHGRRFLVAGSASKAYAMTGWRLGWALGPEPVIAACNALQSHMTSNASSISQRAALAALTGDQAPLAAMREEYRLRRDRILAGLGAIDGIDCPVPGGGFYVFPRVDAYCGEDAPDGTALARRLLDEARVAVVPGAAFGADGHWRISFAASRERIDEGLARIRRFLEGRTRLRR